MDAPKSDPLSPLAVLSVRLGRDGLFDDGPDLLSLIGWMLCRAIHHVAVCAYNTRADGKPWRARRVGPRPAQPFLQSIAGSADKSIRVRDMNAAPGETSAYSRHKHELVPASLEGLNGERLCGKR